MDDESVKKGDGAMNALPRPAFLVAIVLGTLYLVEVIIMNFFHEFAETAYHTMDALILTAVLLPLLYFLIYRPFSRSVKDLKALSGTLERQVWERTVQLEFSEALHRAVIASSADAIIQINVDGVILMANPAAHWMLGYGKTELENKHISLLLPDGYEKVLVEGFAASLDGWDGHRAAPVAEAVAVTKSGKRLTVECTSSECLVNSEISFVIDMRDVSERKNAREALRESEQRYRQLSEASFEGMLINIGGKVVDCNSAFARMFGYEPEEIIGRIPVDLSPPESQAIIMDHIRRGSEEVYDTIGRKKDGTLFPIEMQGRTILYHGQKARLTAMRDITARVKAEEAIRESEGRYRQLSEASFEGVTITVDGKIADCNTSFALKFGYTREGIIGKTPLDLVPPESYAVVADHIGRGSEERYEAVGRKKDGTLFPIEVQGRGTLYHGQKARVTAVRDISERVKAERAIRESEERLRATFDNATAGMAFVNPDGKFARVNAALCRMYGYDGKELIGRSFQEITHPDDLHIGEAFLRQVARGETEKLEVEKRFIRKDGGIIWCSVVASLIKDEHGKPLHLFAHVIDVTARKSVEHALFESENKYRALVEETSDWVWEVDENGVFTYSSPQVLQITGYRAEEFLGKTPFDHMRTEEAGRVVEFFRATAATQRPFKSFENTTLHKDGHEVVVETNGVPYFSAEGRFMGYRGVNRDVTERRRMEKGLAESERKYRNLFQEMVSGFSLNRIVFDERGEPVDYITLEVNRGFEQMLGVSRESVIGKKAYETVPGLDRKWLDIFGKVAITGMPYSYVEYASNVGKWFEGSVFSPGKDLVAGTFIDITNRKRAEDNLRASERRFRAVAQSASDAIISINSAGDIIHWNKGAEKMFGHAEAEALGKPVGLVIPERYDEAHRRGLARAVGGGPFRLIGKTATLEGLRKDGAEFPLKLSLAAWEEGGEAYFTGIIRDITERKAAEEKLKAAKDAAEEATRLKDKFVSLVSHDLKTPLSSMIGFLKLVRHDYAEPLNEGAKLILDRAAESGEAMVRLIDDLLTISRFKTGQLKLNRQFFDAEYLGVMMAGNYAHLAGQKGIEIGNTIPAYSRIYGDKTLLTEAVQNLVTNAIKFCKNGDRITISAGEGDAPVIRVGDTGPGIQSNLLADLFKFEKKTSTTGTAGEIGTGFGLPLVKNIMELHGGELVVESMPGKGCLFSLKLPYVRPRILLVDDDRHSRLLQTLQLREMKADIIEAENGEDALNKLAGVRPDLVITDIQMPVMDGLELLKRIKGAPETRDIPVIVMSGEFGMEIRDTVFKFGADDFVTKKIDKVDFFPRVRRFIG